ncbi:MAG: hypothetical protein GXP62_16655 [Oligoflexia bacterium]|nr:hypothetical protein [Oligoflexia bacterium]
MPKRHYKKNTKHKRGTSGEGPPRWFPSRDSLCPDEIDEALAQELLDGGVDGADLAHPDARAVYAIYEGVFYKAYAEGVEPDREHGNVEVWHGYPVRRELVPRQVPAKVLRTFVKAKRLSRPEYKKLLGSAQ